MNNKSKNLPGISIVMTTYNGEKFLTKQLDSIIKQMSENDELIIVDDHSTDDTIKLISSYLSENISLFQNKENLGVIKSFEVGLKLTKKDFIFLCDQDDIWMKGKKNIFINEFSKDSSILIVISDSIIVDEHNKIIQQSFMKFRGGFKKNIINTILKSKYKGCNMAVNKKILNYALPFPKYVPIHDMWIGIIGITFGKVKYINKPYLRYRRHTQNVTSLKKNSFAKMLKTRIIFFILYLIRISVIFFKKR